MIRSEVQRTLVKSPPELWSELSDPESLARHLGELGEIRITRVEPENLVEWEAEGTTGTVEIKASGWGTRVTLTVSRELPEAGRAEQDAADGTPEAGAPEVGAPEVGDAGEIGPQDEERADEAEADGPADAIEAEAGRPAETIEAEADGPRDVVEAEADAPAETIETGLPTAGAAIQPAAVEAIEEAVPEDLAAADEADEAAESAYEAEAGAADDEPLSPPKPAPATEAARRAAGWPSTSYEPEGWAADASETLAGPSEEAGEVAESEPPAASEPRPGFFARLFRRRRRTEPEAPRLSDPEAEADEIEEGTPESFEAAPDVVVPGEAFAGEPQEAEETLAEEPVAEERVAEEPVAEEPAAEEPEEEAFDAEELTVVGHTEQPQAAQAIEQEIETPVAAVAPDAGDPAQAETLDAAPPDGEAEPDAAAADLSAELLAAEGIAAEQVEAVLTAALDRLGSAHHRPFSRS